jgi:acetylornithine deacetylase/succinyl-diaminopimelate desuccinylase-like protein
VRAMAALLMQTLEASGFAPTWHDTAGAPVITAHAGPERGRAPQILIYGHYDVQPPEPLDAWQSPPFAPEVREGRLYGRGTGDNKGQHLAHILGVRAALACWGALPVGVTMLLEGEEESSSPHLEAFVDGQRQALAAEVAITSDGPMAAGDLPVVALGVRGVLSFELRVDGSRFDQHSGNKGNVVPDPTWRLVEVLSALRSADGRVQVPGFYDRVRPVGELERQALARLPFDPVAVAAVLGLDVARVAAMGGQAYHRRLMLEPTFTVNAIASGQIDQRRTVVPSHARVRCDMRLVADQDPLEVEASLRALLAERFPDVRYTPHGFMRPSRTPLDHPAAAAVARALAAVHGVEPLILPALGGSLPDSVFTRTLGVPSLIVPYANADEANHAPNENLRLDLFCRGMVATAAILDELGRTFGPGRPTA